MMKPNQLRLTITDGAGKEVSVITDMQAIQNIANNQGVKAVDASIVKLFNDLVARVKNSPAA